MAKVKTALTPEEKTLLQHYMKVFLASCFIGKEYGKKVEEMGHGYVHPDDLAFIRNIVTRSNLFVNSRAKHLANKDFSEKDVKELLADDFRLSLSLAALGTTVPTSSAKEMEELFNKIKEVTDEFTSKIVERLSESQANEVREEVSPS